MFNRVKFMSFYLNHIAALSLNMAKPIQPRLPGVFEAAPEINQAANEPAEAWNIELAAPKQELRPEPLAQENHNAPKPLSVNRFVNTAEQSPAPLPVHEPPTNPLMTAVSNPQPKISSHTANSPQPKPLPEMQNINSAPLGQNNTPQISEIEAVKPNIQKQAEHFQPVTALKTADENPVTQPSVRYKPAVERIIEHTVIERTLIDRGDNNITPVLTEHKDPAEQSKQSTFDSPQPNVAADIPVTPKISQHSPVADLKQANPVAAPAKSVLEPRIQVHTPPKETPKIEELGTPLTEPTIQVTIGRIEIRATQNTDKTPAKPRTASTTLSLDDYLKQRNGGRS